MESTINEIQALVATYGLSVIGAIAVLVVGWVLAGLASQAVDKGLAKAPKVDRRVHAEPAPLVAVGELADNSVNIVIRLWCNAGDYSPLKFDMTKALKQRMDAEGISIPYPQRTLHVVGSAGRSTVVAAE